ncbi:MAG: hypothetical protein SGCHY_005371, partial [Lobulomycetales sp.]
MGVKDPQINIHVEFAGGLELLLDGRKEASVALPVADPAAPPRMQQLLLHVADHLVCHSRDLFLKPDTMQLRPGILVLINEVDWELEGECEYLLQEGDRIVLISTWHPYSHKAQEKVRKDEQEAALAAAEAQSRTASREAQARLSFLRSRAGVASTSTPDTSSSTPDTSAPPANIDLITPLLHDSTATVVRPNAERVAEQAALSRKHDRQTTSYLVPPPANRSESEQRALAPWYTCPPAGVIQGGEEDADGKRRLDPMAAVRQSRRGRHVGGLAHRMGLSKRVDERHSQRQMDATQTGIQEEKHHSQRQIDATRTGIQEKERHSQRQMRTRISKREEKKPQEAVSGAGDSMSRLREERMLREERERARQAKAL